VCSRECMHSHARIPCTRMRVRVCAMHHVCVPHLLRERREAVVVDEGPLGLSLKGGGRAASASVEGPPPLLRL